MEVVASHILFCFIFLSFFTKTCRIILHGISVSHWEDQPRVSIFENTGRVTYRAAQSVLIRCRIMLILPSSRYIARIRVFTWLALDR